MSSKCCQKLRKSLRFCTNRPNLLPDLVTAKWKLSGFPMFRVMELPATVALRSDEVFLISTSYGVGPSLQAKVIFSVRLPRLIAAPMIVKVWSCSFEAAKKVLKSLTAIEDSS